MSSLIIAIVGAPGSGKSFLVQKIAAHYQAKAFLEEEEDNLPPFILESFKETYCDLISFKWFRNKLIKDIKEAQKLAQQGKRVILDTFWLSNECYLNMMEDQKQQSAAAELCFHNRKKTASPGLNHLS